MSEAPVKLKRQLFDIFQHCEIHCRAHCCGWMAFDLSDHWLDRWCEWRDVDSVKAALKELDALEAELAGCERDARVSIDHLFAPSCESLTNRLKDIRRMLISHVERTAPEVIQKVG